MRKLIITLVVLLGLAVALDRVGVAVVSSQVATRIQNSEHLSGKPGVSISGFPFITQVFSGKYDKVTVTVHGLRAGDIRLADATITAEGLHLTLNQVFSSDFSKTTVDKALARVRVTYADLNEHLRKDDASIVFASGTIRVSGKVNVGGIKLPASGDGVLSVDAGDLILRVVNVRTRGGVPVPDAVAAAAGMQARIKSSDLPFGIHFLGAGADAAGFQITAGATGLVAP